MPLPNQTFTTIQQLINYINTVFITNGNNGITGEQGNNILNGLTSFIKNYTINNSLAAILSANGGVVVLPKPVTIFTGNPDSIQWADDVQNEYYIVNATGFDIPLTTGFSYTDQFGTAQIVIPARVSIHIAKAINNSWVQINNLPGSGSGGDLPPQTQHNGQFLRTNGTTASWGDPFLFVDNTDFDTDGVTCILPALASNKFDIFFDTIPGFIYEQDGQWTYRLGGGFVLNIPGINANTSQVRFHLFLKGLNS